MNPVIKIFIEFSFQPVPLGSKHIKMEVFCPRPLAYCLGWLGEYTSILVYAAAGENNTTYIMQTDAVGGLGMRQRGRKLWASQSFIIY
jgi:hypothetical protein